MGPELPSQDSRSQTGQRIAAACCQETDPGPLNCGREETLAVRGRACPTHCCQARSLLQHVRWVQGTLDVGMPPV